MEKYIIPNLRNACRLMKWMSDRREGATLQEASQSLDIPRTTTLRIVKTLQAENLIKENNRRYFLGPSLIPLGLAARAGIEIRSVAIPHLQALTRRIDETCHLAIPMEKSSMIVEVNLSPHPLRATSRAGTIVDIHCSATGKIFLAYLHRDSLPNLVPSGGFQRRTPHTLTSLEELQRECEKVKKQGFSTDEEEYHEGVRCIALPVFGSSNQVIGAVGVTASKQRFPKSKTRRIYNEVLETTQAISRELGH